MWRLRAAESEKALDLRTGDCFLHSSISNIFLNCGKHAKRLLVRAWKWAQWHHSVTRR